MQAERERRRKTRREEKRREQEKVSSAKHSPSRLERQGTGDLKRREQVAGAADPFAKPGLRDSSHETLVLFFVFVHSITDNLKEDDC